MQIETQLAVHKNPYLYQYLRENSYRYKALNRDPSMLKIMEEEMKKKYKLTTEDRIENVSRTLGMMKTLLDVIR